MAQRTHACTQHTPHVMKVLIQPKAFTFTSEALDKRRLQCRHQETAAAPGSKACDVMTNCTKTCGWTHG